MAHEISVSMNSLSLPLIRNVARVSVSGDGLTIGGFGLGDKANWAELGRQLIYAAEHGHFQVPEPKYVPWTAQNCPLRLGDGLYTKDCHALRTVDEITLWAHGAVSVGVKESNISRTFWNAKSLLDLYLFNDKPCGTLEAPC